jgi:hypothetical protein
MNEQKKKKIYIAIIVVCMLITGYVLYSMNSSPSAAPVDQTAITPIKTTPRAASPVLGGDPSVVEFSAPPVFPADNKFFTQVFDSDEYTSLTDFDRLNVSPEEVNRDDPFADY